jgi:hypothetical protein
MAKFNTTFALMSKKFTSSQFSLKHLLAKNVAPEAVFVILCCRWFLMTAANTEVRQWQVTHNLDWEKVLFIARAHRVRTLVFECLKQLEIENVSPAVFENLNRTYTQFSLHALHHAAQVNNILLSFAERKIPVLLYKGLALSYGYFPKVGQREFRDIDLILSSFSHLKEATAVLLACGFSKNEDDQSTETPDVRTYHFYKYDNKVLVAHVELHLAIAPKRLALNFSLAQVFEEKQLIKVAGYDWPIPSTAHHLIMCTLHHGGKEAWGDLKGVVDIALLLKRPEINVDQVFKILEQKRLINFFTTGVAMAEILLGQGLAQKWQTGQTLRVKRLAKKRVVSILIPPFPKKGIYNKNFLFFLQMRNGALDKLKVLYFIVLKYPGNGNLFKPTENDFKWVKLPKFLYFLYYIIRPFRLVYALA